EPEPYSSRGPAKHFFAPVSGTTPAAPIAEQVIAKPDLVATDCGATTFFAFLSGGVWRFCGTSAAAPHAAAVAALVRQAKPTLPEQQVRDALTGSASPVGVYGPDAAGSGLVDAFAAINGLPGPIEGGDGPSEVVTPIEKAATVSPNGSGTPSGEATAPSPAPTPTPQPAAKAPETTILRHPRKLVRTSLARVRIVFRFGSNQRGATFLCKLDRSAFRACPARLVRRLAAGTHVLKVKARSVDGLTDPTPAAFRFRIVQS
ncbi:MAG TPA: S8 family serine peptidase, partial [Solirubrobacterales bacterium]|nr:S8 family serine peptidase [Solirubrobacterales bacterium]